MKGKYNAVLGLMFSRSSTMIFMRSMGRFKSSSGLATSRMLLPSFSSSNAHLTRKSGYLDPCTTAIPVWPSSFAFSMVLVTENSARGIGTL